MKQPKGFSNGNKVCKMKKSIYGLKQSALIWNETLTSFLRSQNLQQSITDQCLFYSTDTFILIYVDDIIIISNITNIKKMKLAIANQFNIRDLGPVENFLNVKISTNKDQISLSIKLHYQNIRKIQHERL